jgi:hypothetical protein
MAAPSARILPAPMSKALFERAATPATALKSRREFKRAIAWNLASQ